MEIPKTLIGKNNILFLTNDSAEELKVQCNNLLKVHIPSLSRYTFKNHFLFIYPNKSLIYKDYLPNEYVCRYRPALNIYKKKFRNNLYDLYQILKNETDVYYKTDTHINFKGNYIVYKYFINTINSRLGLNIVPEELEIHVKTCELSTLNLGVGDLTWSSNLGNQTLVDIQDNYYYNNKCSFYCLYKVDNNNPIRFLDYQLNDKTSELEGSTVYWDIISKYIIHTKNVNKVPFKILILYDSLFLSILPLFFYLFNEIYLVKDVYSNELVNLINPDYIFEFRVERFLF